MISPIDWLEKLKQLAHSRDGVALVELGLILPLFAGMIIPLTDVGMGVYNQMQLESAVQAGAGTALTNGYNPNTITASVNTNGASLSTLTITTMSQQCGCATSSDTVVFSSTESPPACIPPCPAGGVGVMGTYVTVAATAKYTPLFSYPYIPNPLTLSAQSVIRIQ